MLLLEIDLHCKTIIRTAEWLNESAEHWTALSQGIDDGKTMPPIAIVAQCTACLSSAASIRRLLFIAERRGKRLPVIEKRCAALMDILGSPTIPVICSVAVRNSWEHLDERLDDLLSTRAFKSYADIHVAAEPPAVGTIALRRFDLVRMEIRYGPTEAIALEPLVQEARKLASLIAKAWTRLETETCIVYSMGATIE
jgi:hypothetical protein